MLGLAIESANQTASAALWRAHDDRQRSDASFVLIEHGALSPEDGKADQLILVIERLLGCHGLGYHDLDVIAVNRGPGSFTGIRSAVALARGLALAADRPVLGVTSHDALLAGLGEPSGDRRPLLAALDARRGEVYVQAFAPDGRPSGAIEAQTPKAVAESLDARPWRLAGSGAALVQAALGGRGDVTLIETRPIDARTVARAAAGQLFSGDVPKPGFALRPLYVRAPDAVPPSPLIAAPPEREAIA